MHSSTSAQSATLLLVDDEKNVISSLKRVLRSKPYQILTAPDGATALQILEENAVDLIISDSQMPGMDGPTLLSHSQQRWPERMRILLTGKLNIGAAIKAINEGEIYRYITKPWDDAELCMVIEDALAYQDLERDRARLQKLTHDQNLALQQANATLEARVQERTAELERTANLLTRANAELHRSYVTSTQVFSSLISQRLPRSRQTNQAVSEWVLAFCKARNMSTDMSEDLAMAAALYNIGKLTWNDALIALPVQDLSQEQAEQYRTYPKVGESLLMALEPANNAVDIIRHHQERWDGRGFPDGLAGEAIPLGARILRLVVDFVEMQMGMQLRRKLSREEVLSSMPLYSGRLYDPALCEEFVHVVSQVNDEEEIVDETILSLGIHALKPGMELVKSLYAKSGMLLLKEGACLTDRLIEKLAYLQENEDTTYTLQVRPADEEDTE
jgi:response regulator RpfG family c-di-GMP phosphodiesterase